MWFGSLVVENVDFDPVSTLLSPTTVLVLVLAQFFVCFRYFWVD